jgi:hypothetical protein
MPKLQNMTERALIACSLWLHIGFIGAAAMAVGLLQLFDGEATRLSALALAFSGGALAAASWGRGRTVLEHAERASAVTTNASGESASRATSKETERSTIATATPIPLQSNWRCDDGRRYPTPE